MASGEREQVLADFQACTQLDDIETCIAILDQNDWNLLQAVQSVMGQSDSPPTGAPVQESVLQGPGDEYFSSGIFSDPIPWRTDTNVMDSATSYDPGSASGPGTSAGTGFSSRVSDKRMLHFSVEYRNRNVDIFMADSETVAQIKETLSVELGIPAGKQELKGWASRKVTDNTVLRDLHLPKENTLFLLTPDLHPSEVIAGTSSRSVENLSRSYNLKITVKESSKYHQISLNFLGSKTVEEVKRDVYNVTDIPVRHQIWTGWPETTEDSKAIGSIGLSYPSHMLELTKSNLAISHSSTKEVAMEMEMSDDEEEFHDFGLDESESDLFSHDHLGGRKQVPLMPESVNNETEAHEHFTREFRERYGECHPVFYVGSLDNAIRDSLLCPAKERKLMAIYLHHDNSIFSNVFCSQIFCNEGIVHYLTNNFITWAWDMTLDTNAARLVTMATRHFGSVAANQIRGYSSDQLPVLLVISRSRTTNEVTDVIRGDVTVDELMSKLIQDHELYRTQQERDIVEEAERNARELVRSEQDAAYQKSLEEDRKKKETRMAEEKIKLEEERKEKQKQEEEERKKREEEAVKLAIQKSLAKEIPDEPPSGCTEVTCSLRIRTPDRSMLNRKFYGSNKLQVVINFITSKGFHLSEYKLLSTFPRKDLSNEDASQTLEELKLCPQETLILEERT